jgi:GDP-6-deoxy-D-talose 4-dehydrogenase
VIGASSFTGQYLVPELESAGYQVDSTCIDLTNAQQVEQAMLHIQPEYIINLAAISFVPDGASTEIYAINTFGPQNILDACLKLPQKPKKIILASTSHIYGEQASEIIDEGCLANPINHYGCSKWAMEQIAKTYRDKLNILITRPFNYTGRGQNEKFLIPKIVGHFQQKKDVISLGNIDIWRDFSDVRWVSQVYSQLLLAQHQNLSVINICSGGLINIRDIIHNLQQLTGREMKIDINPDFIRKVEIIRQRGDNQLLAKTVKHMPQVFSLQETLSWMLQIQAEE